MSKPVLVEALRQTAARLRTGAPYQWGHFGSCNCGHLAQTLTRRSRLEIHQAAVERARDWGDAALEHCPTSGYPIDHILSEMLAVGLSLSDIRHLEELSDRRILARLEARQLSRNRRDDVVRYLEAWADGLWETDQHDFGASPVTQWRRPAMSRQRTSTHRMDATMEGVSDTADLNERLSSPEVRALIVRVVRRRVPELDVEDVVQTVLCDALAAERPPAGDEELRKWIVGITRHKVADFHRRGGRARHVELSDHLEAEAVSQDARDWALWAVKKTEDNPEAQRTLDWMAREGSGEKLAEIAQEERLPATQVRQRVSRLRRWMQREWAAELAAVAAIVIIAIIAWRMLRSPEVAQPEPQPDPAPSVQPDPNLERARELRAEAVKECEREAWERCLEGLDEAARLDPAGDQAPEVQGHRSVAGQALEHREEEKLREEKDDLEEKKKDATPDPSSVTPTSPAPSPVHKPQPSEPDKGKPNRTKGKTDKESNYVPPAPQPTKESGTGTTLDGPSESSQSGDSKK